MKTRFLLTLVGAFISLICHSQELQPNVQWGKEFSAPKRSSLSDIVGFDKTGIYAIKERYGFGTRRYTLEHYDHDFKPTKAFDLDLKEDGKDCLVETILQLKGKLYLFSSVPDTRTKRNTLSVQEINKETLKPENTKNRIAEINIETGSRRNSGNFDIKVSRDSSKVLIFYAMPYEKNEPESFGFYVLNSALQPIWNKEVKIPFENQLFDIESFRVDNDGDVYILGLIYNDKRKKKRAGAPNYKYQVFAYRDKGKTTSEYPVALEDKFLTDMQIEILNNKNIVCAGFYSNKGTYSIRGTYFLTIDPASKQIKTKSFKEFGIEFITQNLTENQAAKTKRKEEKGEEMEMYEYDLDKLIVGKDGSAMLLGEQYFVQVVTSSMMMNGRMQTYSTTHYYYNDIIAVKISPKGEIEWAEKIAKRQHTTEDGGFYSSYAMAIVKGHICFIFNDNPKNLGYDGTGKIANYRGSVESVITMVSLDPTGKQTRKALFKGPNIEVIARPKVCEQITSNDLILFGQRKKTQQFARLTF
jgi:hypothetical protein